MLSIFCPLSSFFFFCLHTLRIANPRTHTTHIKVQTLKLPCFISYCPASSVITGQPPAGVVGRLTTRLKRLAENKQMCLKGDVTVVLCSLASRRWMADRDMKKKKLAVELEPIGNVN